MIFEESPPPILPVEIWNIQKLTTAIEYWNHICNRMMIGPSAVYGTSSTGPVNSHLVPTVNFISLSPLTTGLWIADRIPRGPELRSEEQHWGSLAEHWRGACQPDIKIQIQRHNTQPCLPFDREIAHRRGEIYFAVGCDLRTILATYGTIGANEAIDEGVNRQGFSKWQLEQIARTVKS